MGKTKQPKRSPSKKKPTRKASTTWDADRDRLLIEHLLTAKEKGGMLENSFSQTVFGEAAKVLEENYPAGTGSTPKDRQSVKARWQKVRILFCLYLFSPLIII